MKKIGDILKLDENVVIIFFRWKGEEAKAIVSDGTIYDALTSFFDGFGEDEMEASMVLSTQIKEGDIDETKPMTFHYQEKMKDKLIFTVGKVGVLKEHLEAFAEVISFK